VTALDLTGHWPVPHVSAAVLRANELVATIGAPERVQRLASISKPMTAWTTLVATEEGIVTLDQPVGQPGCTLAHLLCHAGGYPFNGTQPIAKPDTTRIYSNTGIELAADTVAAAAEMSFGDYLHAALFEPLGMTSSDLRGSPAYSVWSNLTDMTRFVGEVMRPQLVASSTADDAKRIHSPGLAGIVPGVGRYEQCPWGLGFELRGDKAPHWTGSLNSPRTYGHFGGSGTMFWVDPDLDLALIALADREFDEWSSDALRLWPELSDAVIAQYCPAATGAAS